MGDPNSAKLLSKLSKAWFNDPVKFVLDTYRCNPLNEKVEVDIPQRKILEAIAKHNRVAIRSAHGIGKTTTAAWATAWWLATRWPARVITLAGTWGHLEDRLWPEIRLWARNWRFREAFEWQHLGVRSLADPDYSRADATSSDIGENIEGFHSPNLLVIIDEAKALPDEAWAAIRGALTNPNSKLLVLSTPPITPSGWYPTLFSTQSDGWRTIHISAHDSPRVSQAWAKEMEQDYGKNSAVYQSKVLGNIPDSAAQVVIPLSWVASAQKRPSVPDRKRPVVTVDVAREGEDLTVIGLIKDSKHEVIYWEPQSTTITVATACKAAVKRFEASMLVIDDTGVGGGVTDVLIMLQRQKDFPQDCTIVPVKFGIKAGRKDRFHTHKDELWWYTREALKQGRIALQNQDELDQLHLPRGNSLVSQLTAPIYEEDLQNRIQVLDHRKSDDKREKMKPLPRKSPDLAHSLILGVKYYLTQQDVQYPKHESAELAANREFWEKMRQAKHGDDGEEYGYSERYRQFDGGF